MSALAAISGSGQSGTVALSPGCTYQTSAVNNSIDGANAFPDVAGNVTVVGNGATIARSSSAPNLRFFLVDDGGSLSISNLTMSGGSIAHGDLHGGGAIMNRSVLTVTGVTFAHNQSLAQTGGGAIDNHDYGQLTVSGSTFDHNVGLQGGAIENEATYCHASAPVCAQATVTDSTFTGNTTTEFGGGGFEGQHNQSGIAICAASWPQAGLCQLPGGTHNTLLRDTFIGNGAMTEGGGVATFGTTTISDSTFTGNSIIGTSADGDLGGGAVQNTGVLTMTQSTLAGDQSQHGGELHAFDVQFLPQDPAARATISQTILAAGGSAADCSGSGTISDGGYNLADDSSCPISSGNHSMSSTNPHLAALADNGGPTQTFALTAGSPAIDAIPTATPGCNGSTDQRGAPRPHGSGCDIGAYEADGVVPTPSPTPSSATSSPSPTAQPGPTASPGTKGPAAVAGATVKPVPAAFAAGVTNTKGVWLIRTVDGVGLYLHPGSAVRIAFAGRDIQLQFLGNRTSGRVRLTLGATHRDVDLRSARARRWLISMHATGTGPHVLTILDLRATKAGQHVGNAVLSRFHVLPAARPGSSQ